jgi:hypothetical protein
MAETKPKKSRLRSPAYPYFALKDAVEKLELFHRAESLHHVPTTVAAKDIGYEPGSSRGWRAIASLLSFGLLEEGGARENREVWLSDLAKEIVHFGNKDSEEAKRAIRIAALKPTIHSELWDLWLANGESLPSDETMKRTLLRDKAFNPKAVDSFIQEFRDSLTYAGLIKDGRITSVDTKEKSTKTNTDTNRTRISTGKSMTTTADNLQEMTIPLIGGSTAILAIPRPLSKKNYDQIRNWLALMEPALIEDESKPTKEDEPEE